MLHLAAQLEGAFNSIGCSMIPDDFAAKLLAYVYVMGGGNEAVVTHQGLNAGISIAQKKFNLYGGETPNSDGIKLIKHYTNELERLGLCTPWLWDIFKRYALSTAQLQKAIDDLGK